MGSSDRHPKTVPRPKAAPAPPRPRVPARGSSTNRGWPAARKPDRRGYPTRMGPSSRDATAIRIIMLAVWGPLVVLAVLQPGRSGSSLVGAAVPLALMPLGLLLAGLWADRFRYGPATPAIVWVLLSTRRAWAAIDGGPPPVDAEEGLRRLGDRDDTIGRSHRATLLARLRRWAELEALIAGWHDDDPVAVGRRARAESRLAWLRDGLDDTAAADAAAAAIPDAEQRRNERVWNLYERAMREAAAGRDSVSPLLEASQLVVPLDAETAREFKASRRRVLLWTMVPPVVAMLTSLASIALLGAAAGFWVAIAATPLLMLVLALRSRRPVS